MRRAAAPGPLVLLLLVGCAAPAPGPEPRGGDGEDAGLAPSTGTLIVLNDSPAAIFRVRFSPTDARDWGKDRLDPSEVIVPGDRRAWQVPEGEYHIQIEFKDGSGLDGLEGYLVGAGEETVCRVGGSTPAAPQVGVLTLENATGWAIASVHFSLTTEMSWGDERLGPREVFPPRRRRSWTLPPGHYNVRVLFQDGVALETPRPFEVVVGREAVYPLEVPPGE